MNLRDLKYLVVLAQEKNFGRAAKRCHCTQPTLSMQIRKLEDGLGLCLFERDKRNVRITADGEAVLAYAKDILDQVELIKELSVQRRDPFAGTFSLGIIPTSCSSLLPHMVPVFQQNLPRLELKLSEEITDRCIDSLLAGEIDAAIVATDVVDSRLESMSLFEEQFYLACNSTHKLSQIDTLLPQHIPENELLLLKEGHCLREQGLDFCLRIGKSHNTAFFGTSLNTILAMVALGEGITLVPALFSQAAKSMGLHCFALRNDSPTRRLRLVSRKKFTSRKLILRCAECIKQSVSGLRGVRLL